MSILIKNAKILDGDKLIEKNILIVDKFIREISNDRATVDKVIDAKGNIALPGIIDSHVHFREPGLTHKEDFFTGSCAAAAGGVTTILDMPNTNPPTVTLENLKQKRELAKKSIVNYGFHFGATQDNIGEIKKARKIASVKVFMDISTGKMMINDDEALKKIFSTAKLISVHAEAEKVQKAIDLIQPTKNRLYLCHISSENELKIIKHAKTSRHYTEITPHHLFLTEDDAKQLGNFGLMKPVLKTRQDQDALWQAIEKNKIDVIASDHAPHTIEEKQSENPPYGIPGTETMLPLLLDAVNKNRLSLRQVVKLCCENPARIFGIKNRGQLKEEYYADLVIIDINKEKKVENEKLYTKCKWSPFNGKTLKGLPIITIVNGNIVFENDQIIDIKAREVGYYERENSKSPV